MMKSLVFVAAAAMGLTACQNDFEEQIAAKDSVVVTFVTDSADSRTLVDTSDSTAPVFAWGENETFAVLEQTDALAEATAVTYENVEGKAKITATFDNNAGKESYQYVTVYPATGYVSAEGIEAATLILPAEQTMAEGSYDPNADLMVSEVVTKDAQPSDAQMIRFTRLAAVAKMSLTNFGVELGDKVRSVTFTADGKTIAGKFTTDLAAPVAENVEGGSSVVVTTTSSSDIYFTLVPTTIAVGESFSVTIVTDKRLYVRKVTIAEGKKPLTFEAGNVTRFSVNMQGVAPSDKWVLVKDVNDLESGDIVTIVAKDHDKAISKKLYNNGSETATNTRRDAVDITKYQNYLIANENVQPFILVSGTTEGTFSFYDEAREKFLVSNNKSSRYLINQEYISDDTSFAFTIDLESGDATIKNTVGEYTGNMIRYYNSSKYFYSGTSANQAVCVYKLAGAVGTVPVVAANVTVPEADEYVVVAEEGVAEATAIEEVVFNYVGDWTITATSEAEWITSLSYDKEQNCLTYTAEQNTSAKRETTVTIEATLEGQEPLSWTFNVLQKGAPQDITIAEFVKLDKDENSTYRITGRITEMTTSSSGTFKLTDGTNVATVTYLYTDGGVKVSGNTEIGVAVGDVMTVTTVPVGSGKGGNSSHYSIYKGHYGFKTTLGIAAGYTGGDVTIEVETYSNGNVDVPEAVVATMAESDFATLSYSGGDTATVTFTSENTSTEAREVEVTFTYGLASVTVIAQQGINPANKLGYELVTDASTLAVGDEVIIVAKNANKALACPTKTSDTKLPSTDIEKTGNVIYDIEDAGVQVFTLVAGATANTMAFEFTYKDGTIYYPYYSSGLKMRTSINAAASWDIAITEDGDATISTISSSKNYYMKFNSATAAFTSYLSTATNATKAENAICIYKKQAFK